MPAPFPCQSSTDHHRHLGVSGSPPARSGPPRPRRPCVDGHHRLMVVVVDLGQVPQISRGEAFDRGEEPPVTRFRAEAGEPAAIASLSLGSTSRREITDRSSSFRVCAGCEAAVSPRGSRVSAAPRGNRRRALRAGRIPHAAPPPRTIVPPRAAEGHKPRRPAEPLRDRGDEKWNHELHRTWTLIRDRDVIKKLTYFLEPPARC